MSRTAWTWVTYFIAATIVLAVMSFFTLKTMQYEKRVALADAHASMEETIRLALWRVDSAAAILMEPGPRPNRDNRIPPQNQLNADNQILNYRAQTNGPEERLDPMVQQALSQQEFRTRAMLEQKAGDWRKIEPALLDRISDILPGATLEAVPATQPNPDDTRRLASIPARLVVPASALPAIQLPWNTPLRISLIIAWSFTILATAAVARLLSATLALSERRGAFASAVTHELRTPLTTCRMYAEMLATGMISDPLVRQQYLNTLLGESDRLGQLIENVLAYARLERRIAPARSQSFSLPELFSRVMPGLRRRVAQAGLEMNEALPADFERYACRVDPVALEQILLNLVDNACKYGKTTIEMKLSIVRDELNCRISDSGSGVAGEQRKRLFTAFSKSKTDTVPGIGLGLYLSRRLARDMDGDVQYEPENPGSSFVLSVPVSAVNDADKK